MSNNNVLGTAFISVSPSLANFGSDLVRELAKIDFAPATRVIEQGMNQAFNPHSVTHGWANSLANTIAAHAFLTSLIKKVENGGVRPVTWATC